MSEKTDSDRKPLLSNGNLRLILSVLAAFGVGGGGVAGWRSLDAEDPQIARLEKEAAELRAQIEQQKERRVGGLEGDVSVLKGDVSALKESVGDIRGVVRAIDANVATWMRSAEFKPGDIARPKRGTEP